MPKINKAPMAKVCEVRNMAVSTRIALGLSLLLGSAKLMATIKVTKIRNTQPMRSRNGTLGIQFFMPKPNGIVAKAATKAALAVARFQKKPNTNMATTPGEISPVNSWMNWKPCSKRCSCGATNTPMAIATKITIRPVITCLRSSASLSKYFL